MQWKPRLWIDCSQFHWSPGMCIEATLESREAGQECTQDWVWLADYICHFHTTITGKLEFQSLFCLHSPAVHSQWFQEDAIFAVQFSVSFTKHYGNLQSEGSSFPLLCGPLSYNVWSLNALFIWCQMSPMGKKRRFLPGFPIGTHTAALASKFAMLPQLEEGVSLGGTPAVSLSLKPSQPAYACPNTVVGKGAPPLLKQAQSNLRLSYFKRLQRKTQSSVL